MKAPRRLSTRRILRRCGSRLSFALTLLVALGLSAASLAALPGKTAAGHDAATVAVAQEPKTPQPSGGTQRPGLAQQSPAQQPPARPNDPRARIRSTVELVVVPVTVKDSIGGLVGDLTENEFRVFEDGVEQHISLFSAETSPLSVVVLLDANLKAKAAEQLQKSLVALAGGFSASDEVAIGRFDAYYTPVLDFTSDNDGLITELKRLDLSDPMPGVASDTMASPPTATGQPAPIAPPVAQKPLHGGTTKHVDDAIHAAAELLRGRDRQRRKIVIIVSDGANARDNKYSYDETLKLLLSSDISVYAIGLDEAFFKRGLTDLSHYAHATGGDVYYVARGSALPALYAQVSEQARHQYTIGYVPSDTDRTKEYHPIEVRIRRPGLTLLARDGYYLVPRL